MSREQHEFQFEARVIAEAATEEAEYHRRREAWWTAEYETAIETVRETASVKIREYPVTGGKRADVVVDHGDPSAYKRMKEAFEKIGGHREAAERYETDARIYGTQGDRAYELSADDVHYFRLGGERRPE